MDQGPSDNFAIPSNVTIFVNDITMPAEKTLYIDGTVDCKTEEGVGEIVIEDGGTLSADEIRASNITVKKGGTLETYTIYSSTITLEEGSTLKMKGGNGNLGDTITLCPGTVIDGNNVTIDARIYSSEACIKGNVTITTISTLIGKLDIEGNVTVTGKTNENHIRQSALEMTSQKDGKSTAMDGCITGNGTLTFTNYVSIDTIGLTGSEKIALIDSVRSHVTCNVNDNGHHLGYNKDQDDFWGDWGTEDICVWCNPTGYAATQEDTQQTGWVGGTGSWKYYNSDGSMATGWQTIGGSYYYFYSSGAMAANTWIGNYYVNASGVWTKSK